MCQLAYVPIYIFRAPVPSCLKLFPAYVRSFVTCLRAYNHSQNILRLTFVHRSLASKTAYLNLTCGVLLSQVVHGQRQQFEDPLRNYLKQWTVSSVLSS